MNNHQINFDKHYNNIIIFDMWGAYNLSILDSRHVTIWIH